MSVEQTSQWTSLKHMGDLTVWNAMETCLPMVVTVCLLESLGIPFASLLMFHLTGSPEQEHLNDSDVIVLTSTLFMGGSFWLNEGAMANEAQIMADAVEHMGY